MDTEPEADRRNALRLHQARRKKRAARRFKLALKKREARRIYPHDAKARLANHLATCSCPMCGNPRRHFNEDTLQEKRARRAAEDSLREADLA